MRIVCVRGKVTSIVKNYYMTANSLTSAEIFSTFQLDVLLLLAAT